MAIDLTTPTIRPPSALDVTRKEDDDPTTQMLQTSIAQSGAPTLAPPGGGIAPPSGINQQFQDFAGQTLQAPTRFDIPLVQQGIDLIESDLGDAEQRTKTKLDEFHSSRGLVGSSVEAGNVSDMLVDLQRERSRRMFDLQNQMAQTAMSDRLGAAQIAGQAGGMDLQNRALQLEQQGMNRDDAYRYAIMEQQGSQFGQGLEQRESEFSRQYGLSGQELDLRAQQIQQQAQAEGRSLDIEEARLQAQQEQFGQQMDVQREQFAAELGLSREQLDIQRDQMTAEYGDRQSQRMHEMGLQEGSQEFQAMQNTLDRSLEQQALDLQRQGLDAESAWREADRQLQERLEGRALDLQQQGMALDEAYRQAALDMEAEMSNQQASLSAADIYLRALAAGAADELPEGQSLNLPSYPLIGGGQSGGLPGSGGSGSIEGYPYLPPPTGGGLSGDPYLDYYQGYY